MQKLVLASSNKGKIAEFKQIFKGYEIVPMEELGFTVEKTKRYKTNQHVFVRKAQERSL